MCVSGGPTYLSRSYVISILNMQRNLGEHCEYISLLQIFFHNQYGLFTSGPKCQVPLRSASPIIRGKVPTFERHKTI